jgi:hypothetical protein
MNRLYSLRKCHHRMASSQIARTWLKSDRSALAVAGGEVAFEVHTP